VSLAKIASDLRVNKSLLAYYVTLGLIKPVAKAGKVGIYDEDGVKKTFEKIMALKKQKKNLREIIQIISGK
jgi:predicted site-specific integrase-resolvase